LWESRSTSITSNFFYTFSDRIGQIDHTFTFNGTTQNGSVWKGHFQSNLFHAGQFWRIQSLKNPDVYYESVINGLPIGRHTWQLGPKNSMCGLKPGSSVLLTFSTCYPNLFTCSNGQCINLVRRCDNKIGIQGRGEQSDFERFVKKQYFL
jgi:hypothetical protein